MVAATRERVTVFIAGSLLSSAGSNHRQSTLERHRPMVPVLAALGVAESSGFVAGVVALDAALHSHQATLSEARDWLTVLARRPGKTTMRSAVAAANALSESVLESQTRLVLIALGYQPRLQVTLRTSDGGFVARVDMLIDDLGVVVEVDGRVKYHGPNSTEVFDL